jgi:hypothetical protein
MYNIVGNNTYRIYTMQYDLEIIACKVIHSNQDALDVYRYTMYKTCRVLDYNDNGTCVSIIYYGAYAIPKTVIYTQYVKDKHKHIYI